MWNLANYTPTTATIKICWEEESESGTSASNSQQNNSEETDGIPEDIQNDISSNLTNIKSIKSIDINNKTGYLVDIEDESSSVIYYNSTSKRSTKTQRLDAQTILIDEDDDGDWDYQYNTETNAYSSYIAEKEIKQNHIVFNKIWMILIGSIIGAIAITIIFIKNKQKPSRFWKNYKPNSE